MTLKIYGIAARAPFAHCGWRKKWDELRHIAQRYQDGATHTPEFLALNPNGHIPSWTTTASSCGNPCLCAVPCAAFWRGLSRQHCTAPPSRRSRCVALTFWTVTELEKDALTVLMHRVAMPAETAQTRTAQAAEKRLAAPMRVLEQHLQKRSYIAGERFTVPT